MEKIEINVTDKDKNILMHQMKKMKKKKLEIELK